MNDPELLDKFVQAVVDGWDIHTHPDDAADAAYLLRVEIKTNPYLERGVWIAVNPNVDYFQIPINRDPFTLDNTLKFR